MTRTVCTAISLVSLVFAAAARAQTTRTIDYAAGATVSAALPNVRPGDTLVLRGVCRESVSIPANVIDGNAGGGFDRSCTDRLTAR